MATQTTVLLMGIDPALIDFTTPEYAAMPGLTAEKVDDGVKQSILQLNELGYDAQLCWTDFGATAVEVLKNHLLAKHYDCVLIGAGIRKPESNLFLLEKAINTILEVSPTSKICFNSHPMDTIAAVQHWVKSKVSE